jgi:hypothetical protein
VRLRTALQAVGDAAALAVSSVGLLADEIRSQRAALAETTHRPWPLPAGAWLMGRPGTPCCSRTGRQPGGAPAADPRASGARPAGGPSLAWCDPVRGGWPPSAGHSPAALALPLPRAERAHLRRLRGPRRNIFLQPRCRAPRGSRRRPTGVPAAVLPRRHDCPSPGPNGALREQAGRLERASAQLRASYGPTGPRLPVDDGSLERWLAERYCLYVVDERRRALRADIHHPPWPLQPARAAIELNTMVRPLGLELDSGPLLNYSARQDTLVWALEAA